MLYSEQVTTLEVFARKRTGTPHPGTRTNHSGPGHNGKHSSVPTAIAGAIRDKILRGVLMPGERITESALSKELQAGQPSVREALFTLEREGLVRRVANLGTFVTELDLKDISNMYQIRAELEGLAGELAASRAKPRDIEHLQDLAEAMKQGAQESGKWGFLQADLAFHRELWRLSGNPHLAVMLESIVVPLLAFGYTQVERTNPELLQSAEVHMQIVEGMRKGPAECREAVRANMRIFLDRYFRYVLNGVLPERS